jgi:hypothetical protein
MIASRFHRPTMPTGAQPARRTIPFDYAFRFELEGERENVLQTSLQVSIEASFTAVAIGYGVVPSRKAPAITFGPVVPPPRSIPRALFLTSTNPVSLRGIALSELLDGLAQAVDESAEMIGAATASALQYSIRLNPEVAERAFQDHGNAPLDAALLEKLFQIVPETPDQIQFLYTLVDEGSGREFQSEPILNIAGLGISNGDRPFRYFARPIVFEPMSTITMRITELSEFTGELHVSLQGYKTLGGAGTPTSATRGRTRRR